MTKHSIMIALRAVPITMALGCSLPANAEVTTQTVTIQGSVYAGTPCVINKNATINVPFGDVQIEKIDGSYRTVKIYYELDCIRPAKNELRMKITGFQWWYGLDNLQVRDQLALGIGFIKDGRPLALDDWSNFNAETKPVLQAVLKRKAGEEVTPGPFSVGATLVVEYR